jgi:hypothetical protein
MPPKRQKGHLLPHSRSRRPFLQPLGIHTVAERSNQQRNQPNRSLASLRREDDDPFVSRAQPVRRQLNLLQSAACLAISQELASSDELQRDVPARPQASIARLRVTANLLEPASLDELYYDHVPARPPAFLTRPQAIVDRLEPDSSDDLLRAFRSLPSQPVAVQTTPRTARRSEVRRQQETEASP